MCSLFVLLLTPQVDSLFAEGEIEAQLNEASSLLQATQLAGEAGAEGSRVSRVEK